MLMSHKGDKGSGMMMGTGHMACTSVSLLPLEGDGMAAKVAVC